MDLRKYNPTPQQIQLLKAYSGYQPFILSDNCQSGAGYDMMYNEGLFIAERNRISQSVWSKFVELNERMRQMYDAWISTLCDLDSHLSDLTICDTACNQGYFLYRFLDKGVRHCTGYDLRDFTPSFEVLNTLTGFHAKFINTPYDMMKHEIPGAEPADIVISSAIMCHVSDPIYYLNFLGSITKKVLFLFSTIDRYPGFRIIYDGAKHYPLLGKYPFPICFDELNHVSRPLIDFGLKELGFTKIMELPHQQNWMPKEWYQDFQAIIALR